MWHGEEPCHQKLNHLILILNMNCSGHYFEYHNKSPFWCSSRMLCWFSVYHFLFKKLQVKPSIFFLKISFVKVTLFWVFDQRIGASCEFSDCKWELLHWSSPSTICQVGFQRACASFWLTRMASPHHCSSSMPPPPTRRQNQMNLWNYLFSFCQKLGTFYLF